MSSTRMRARRIRAGAISCFSGLSAPMAATKHPLKSKSSVRIGDFDVVQVIQMSISLTTSRTLGAGVAEHVDVEFACANASARAWTMSNTRTVSRGKTALDDSN